jgi:hypothetical protein
MFTIGALGADSESAEDRLLNDPSMVAVLRLNDPNVMRERLEIMDRGPLDSYSRHALTLRRPVDYRLARRVITRAWSSFGARGVSQRESPILDSARADVDAILLAAQDLESLKANH